MAVQRPFTGMFLALVSHYILDCLPHYGQRGGNIITWFRYKSTWAVEGLNLIGLPLLLFMLYGQPWWVYMAAAAAIAPDVVWVLRYWRYDRLGLSAEGNWLTRFHEGIQWGERPWGAAIEIPFFIGAVLSVAMLLK
jgi:hypothetical protein